MFAANTKNKMATSSNAWLLDHVGRIARHEGGHYLVARQLGFQTCGISLTLLTADGGHRGEAEIFVHKPTPLFGDVANYLTNRIAVLYAGAIGEAFIDGKVSQESFSDCVGKGGRSDKEKADELVQLLRNMTYPGENRVGEIENQLNELTGRSITVAEEILELKQPDLAQIERLFRTRYSAVGLPIEVSDLELQGLLAGVADPSNGAESTGVPPT